MSSVLDTILQRLIDALDHNYNVKDSDTIYQILAHLGQMHVTKEALEATRLAKHINLLRKNSNDILLKRRAKSLLKKWRELVLPEPPKQRQKQQLRKLQQKQAILSTGNNLLDSIPNDSSDISSSYDSNRDSDSQHMQQKHHGQIRGSSVRDSSYTTQASPYTSNSSNQSMGQQIYNNDPNQPSSNVKNTNSSIHQRKQAEQHRTHHSQYYNASLDAVDNSAEKIRSLPRIPKIKNSVSSSRVSSSNTMPDYNASSIPADDRLVLSFGAHHKTHQSMVNGQEQNYNLYNMRIAQGQNENSRYQEAEPNVGDVELIVGEMKKKHKKHKKDKKNKKHKRSSPKYMDEQPISDELSFDAPSDTNAFGEIVDDMATNKYGTLMQSSSNRRWNEQTHSNIAGSISDNNHDTVIHVSSSDGSNSPKYNLNANYPSRSSSPPIPSQSTLQKHTSASSTDDQHFWQYNPAGGTRNTDFNQPTISPAYIETPTQSAHNKSSTLSAYNDANIRPSLDVMSTSDQPLQAPAGKKRGRKKGSKGIDTQLGGKSSSHNQSGTQYFDSLSLSTLKDKMESIRSSSKKVKTITELVADLGIMRNLSAIDDEDTIVEPSSRSSCNTETDNNGDVDESKASSREKSVELEDGAEEPEPEPDHEELETENVVVVEAKSSVDRELEELDARLPPIDRTILPKWRRNIAREIPCTCNLIEVKDEPVSANKAETSIDLNTDVMLPDAKNVEANVPKMLPASNSVQRPVPQNQQKSTSIFEVDDTNIDDPSPWDLYNNSTTHTSLSPSKSESTKKKPIKSIFDIDYDEDDDPINFFKSNHNNTVNINNYNSSYNVNMNIDDKTNNCDFLRNHEDRINRENNNANNNNFKLHYGDTVDDNEHNAFNGNINRTTNASLAELPSNQANGLHYGNAQNDLMEPSSATPVPPIQPAVELYRIEEDEHCKAKEYYVTSKELVTDFHINVLHNMYVPNVNGNWDDRTEAELEKPRVSSNSVVTRRVRKPKIIMEKKTNDAGASDGVPMTVDDYTDDSDDDLLTEAEMGLYERVVPLCNYRIMDRLPKSLKVGDVQFCDSDELDLATFLHSIGVQPKKIDNDDDDDVANNSNGVQKIEDEPMEEDDFLKRLDDEEVGNCIGVPTQSDCPSNSDATNCDAMQASNNVCAEEFVIIPSANTDTHNEQTQQPTNPINESSTNKAQSCDDAASPMDCQFAKTMCPDNLPITILSSDEEADNANDCVDMPTTEMEQEAISDEYMNDSSESNTSESYIRYRGDGADDVYRRGENDCEVATRMGIRTNGPNNGIQYEENDLNAVSYNGHFLDPNPEEICYELDPATSFIQDDNECDAIERSTPPADCYPEGFLGENANEFADGSTDNEDDLTDDRSESSISSYDIAKADLHKFGELFAALDRAKKLEREKKQSERLGKNRTESLQEVAMYVAAGSSSQKYNVPRTTIDDSRTKDSSPPSPSSSTSSSSTSHNAAYTRLRLTNPTENIFDPLDLAKSLSNGITKQQHENVVTNDCTNPAPPMPNQITPAQSSSQSSSIYDYGATIQNQLPDIILADDDDDDDDIIADDNASIISKEASNSGDQSSSGNNYQLPSFNTLSEENGSGVSAEGYKFREWHEVVHRRSYNNELLTILPYVVID